MSTSKSHDTSALDTLTGGAFSAPTSGERAARVRDWLATDPSVEQMQEVFRELSARDKGAARPLKDRLDELKRAREQEAIAAEWAERAQALLAPAKLNIADALAWQRDAAKAGAPLSREPLAGLKAQLAERVRGIEDLQHRVQVQREAAVLLAQRIEILSTKPLRDAQAAVDALRADVPAWQAQADALQADAHWASVDLKFPPLLDASRAQLQAVWDAFDTALAQATAALGDAQAALPPVPVWADEIRQARGLPPEAAAEPARTPHAPKAAKPAVDPEQRAAAEAAVRVVLDKLEKEIAEGHGKASVGAANALRAALKEHGPALGEALEHQAQSALAAAGELESWQRWRADQLRQELVARAEALFERPAGEGKPPKAPKPPRAPKGAKPGDAAAEAAGQVTDAQPAGEGAPLSQVATANPSAEAPARAESAPTEPTPAPVDAAAAPAPEAQAPAAPEAASAEAAVPAADAQPIAETPAADVSPAETPAETPAQRAPKPASAPNPTAAPKPRFGGRKMQEQLRELREQWKQIDQGGAPNHALWKRFDAACNEAYKVVQAWLDKVKAESAEHKAQRLALIEEVKAWTAEHAAGSDWKAQARAVHQFSERWRNAGHLSEKAFAELQPQWKAAISAAAAPLDAAQKASTERRHALIEEAKALGAAPMLRIDAVKALQQRWQAEAQAVPLDRKHEQRLWDAFRAPIDEAFQRKGAERDKQTAALSARDRAVLEASKALDAASASGDAARIRAAMTALEQALKAQADAASLEPNRAAVGAQQGSGAINSGAAAATGEGASTSDAAAADAGTGTDSAASDATTAPETAAETDAASAAEGSAEAGDAPAAEAAAPAPAPAPAPAAPRKVVAVRGDDRPGAKRAEPAPAGKGKFDARRPGDKGGPGGRFGDRREGGREGGRFGDRGDRFGDRREREDRGPRLGDAAFRAQRDAMEHAQQALRKLAAQAHGEALTQVMAAWEQRSAEQLPGAPSLGRAVTPAVRTRWAQAVGTAPGGDASQALLRLEIAAEVPTPAEQLSQRRMMQLQLLTQRNAPQPAETWGEDAAKVLASAYDAGAARRLQNALKALLKR